MCGRRQDDRGVGGGNDVREEKQRRSKVVWHGVVWCGRRSCKLSQREREGVEIGIEGERASESEDQRVRVDFRTRVEIQSQ